MDEKTEKSNKQQQQQQQHTAKPNKPNESKPSKQPASAKMRLHKLNNSLSIYSKTREVWKNKCLNRIGNISKKRTAIETLIHVASLQATNDQRLLVDTSSFGCASLVCLFDRSLCQTVTPRDFHFFFTNKCYE